MVQNKICGTIPKFANLGLIYLCAQNYLMLRGGIWVGRPEAVGEGSQILYLCDFNRLAIILF